MILTPHALVGSGLAVALRLDPASALVLGFFSHFVLDAIPHWDYKIKSFYYNREQPLESRFVMGSVFLVDFLKVSFDGLLGLVLSLIFFSVGFGASPFLVLLGAAGALLPDFLQFVYYQLDRQQLLFLQRIHGNFHGSWKIKNPYWGLLNYAVFIFLLLVLSSWRFFI